MRGVTDSVIIGFIALRVLNGGLIYSGIRTTPDTSIYFHMYKFLQRHHYLFPEPPNDFD